VDNPCNPPPALHTSLPGLDLAHPVMNASGILGSSLGGLMRLRKAGVAALVTKSFTIEKREGYPTPIAIPLPYGMVNAVGLANPGIEGLKPLVSEAVGLGLPVVVSIAASTPEEAEALAKAAVEAGAAALEVNLSCPHAEKRGLEVGVDPELSAAIVEAASSAGAPVYAKLGLMDNLPRRVPPLLDAGAKGVVLINTLKAMVIDVYAEKPILGHGVGGLSGPAIHPIAVRAVYEVYGETGAPIIGVGGVTGWKEAAELILAGARAVQVGTGIVLLGEGVVCSIVSGLASWLKGKGYESISEAVGAAHKR